MEKSIISLQLLNEHLDKLKEIADRECTSVSFIIRKLIIKFLREEGDK